MRQRPSTIFRPGLEPLEAKRPLSAGASTAPFASPGAGTRVLATRSAHAPGAPAAVPMGDGSPLVDAHPSISIQGQKPSHGFLVFRRTNPNRFNDTLIPPFPQVLVQSRLPVPGQVYNVLYVVVRNGTAQTFDASSGFAVRLSGQSQPTPILTGTQQWKPGQQFVFYVLTKKYYPLRNQVTDGFIFDLGGARSVAIPGPSGIFLRIKYNPATFARTLDWIVAFGPGAQGGRGVKFGMPDTAINEFVSAKTRRSDFGGYF